MTNLPLIVEGESKRVYQQPDGNLRIELKPTVYSYTHNRGGTVEGTDALRLRFMRACLPIIQDFHSYRSVEADHVVARGDLTLPPVEVRVKMYHVGTPKHRYYGFEKAITHSGCRVVDEDGGYCLPFLAFDWRNPLKHPETGERLADEVLPDSVAAWFMNVQQARFTALSAFTSLSVWFEKKGFELVDICFVIDVTGSFITSEVSPDCMRVRDIATGKSHDKDLWRGGDPPEALLAAWTTLCERVEAS